MKDKVIKAFLDAKVGHLRNVGDVCDVPETRFHEINGNSAGPFLVEVEEPAKVEPEKKEPVKKGK